MLPMTSRIRRARALSSITQADLARRLSVKRSAVSQWETASGTTPSLIHLTQVACETGVCFEWLATGRGPVRPDPGAFDSPVIFEDFAQDDLESRGLTALRRLSRNQKNIAVSIIELLAT